MPDWNVTMFVSVAAVGNIAPLQKLVKRTVVAASLEDAVRICKQGLVTVKILGAVAANPQDLAIPDEAVE